jgi:hypothetical protein
MAAPRATAAGLVAASATMGGRVSARIWHRFSTVIESDVPVVVQYTRLDSRQAENALLSTMVYPADD